MKKSFLLRVLQFPLLVVIACCLSGCTPDAVVSSPTFTDVTATTATLGGDVTAALGSDLTANPITERGVIYARYVDSPNLSGASVMKATTGGSLGVFTVGITGLAANTEYVFCAYAKNAKGTSFSTISTFTTLAAPTPAMVGSSVEAIAVQPDGMHLIGGSFSMIGGAPHGNLARFRADGTLDASFTPNVDGSVMCIAVQPDAKIVIGGSFTSVNGTAKKNIARLLPNGNIDTSFDPGTGTDDTVLAMGIQHWDGKILIGGRFKMVNGWRRNYIARLRITGAHDNEFNAGTGLDVGPSHAVYGLAVQQDQQIVIAGNFTTFNGTPRNRIARLTTTGSLDTAFNPGTGADDSIHCVSLQANGKIIIGGAFTRFNGTPRYSIARLWWNGALDTTFDIGELYEDSLLEALAVQADGKILAGGSAGYISPIDGSERRVSFSFRFNTDGSVDTTVNPSSGIDSESIRSLALRQEGEILAGAQSGATFYARAGNQIPTTESLIATKIPGDLPYVQWQWLRGGTTPEVSVVTFEVSTDGGTTWRSVGPGETIPGGWEITRFGGMLLPERGLLRARGRTSDGSSGGLVEKIAAFPSPPAVIDPTFAGVNGTSATLGGKITTNGASIPFERGVIYARTTANPNLFIDGPGVTKVIATGIDVDTGVFTQLVTGLTPATHYTFKAYAINAAGVNYTAASSFETSRAPTVYTYQGYYDSQGFMLFSGTVVSDGGSPITQRGMVYAATTKSDPLGTKDSWSIHITGGQVESMLMSLHNLVPGTEYAFACFATNSVGTSYGDVKLFTTRAAASAQYEGKSSATALTGTAIGALPLSTQAAGTFDDTFQAQLSDGGIVQAIAVQPDGKILIAGEFTSVGGANHLRLARIDADGMVDPTFTTEVNGPVYSITVQSDGKILLGGLFNQVNGATRNGLARLEPDGSVENEETFNPGSGTDNLIYSVAVQPDGKIVIGGLFTSVQGTASNRIARLHANGSLDTSFKPTSGANDAVYSVAVQADGKILIGGHFTNVNGTSRNRIARLLTSGALDTTFNPGTGADARVTGVALQADGKILIGGSFNTLSGNARSRIARLLDNGTLDATFDPGTGANDHVYTLTVQADGKILIGGRFTQINGTTRNRIARLLASGGLDTAFDPGTGADNEVHAVALQEDGSILMGGYFGYVDGNARQGIARLTNAAATQAFTVADGTQLKWLRGGSAPEVFTADFELSIDGGTTWSDLGTPERITGGWSLAGQKLPRSGMVRSLGMTAGGFLGSSSGVVVDTVTYNHGPVVAGLKAKLVKSKKREKTLKRKIKATQKKIKTTKEKKKVIRLKLLKKKLVKKHKKAKSKTLRTMTSLNKYP
jgi:uncharacterized delta-60 repeat protein